MYFYGPFFGIYSGTSDTAFKSLKGGGQGGRRSHYGKARDGIKTPKFNFIYTRGSSVEVSERFSTFLDVCCYLKYWDAVYQGPQKDSGGVT